MDLIHKDNLISFLTDKGISYNLDVDLKKRTWLHRGGQCSIFIIPTSCKQLFDIAFYLYQNNVKFLLCGYTSNMYILNSSNIDVIISTIRCNKCSIENEKLICDAGVSVSKLAKQMVNLGVIGFEYLTQLPGTVGAALYNNSSCHSNSLSRLLQEVEFLREDGTLIKMTYSDFEFEYRNSILKQKRLNGVIIKAVFNITYGNIDRLKNIVACSVIERENSLEGNSHNLGCTVNQCFINGPMPLRYRIPLFLFNCFQHLFEKDVKKRLEKGKNFLCRISGFPGIAPYVSSKNPIIYLWLDDEADMYFPQYLKFMSTVYKTDRLEIEIVK